MGISNWEHADKPLLKRLFYYYRDIGGNNNFEWLQWISDVFV